MAGLTGLSGLSYPDAVVPVPQASAAEVQGGSADPRHGQGTIQNVYPWQTVPTPGPEHYHGPYGTANELLGYPADVMPAGSPTQDPRADLTPIRHAAPWPTTGVRDSAHRDLDNAAADLQQLATIHGSNTGAAREITYTLPQPQGNWRDGDYVSPGMSQLAPGIPKQIAGSVMGRGSLDRVHNPMTVQNGYGFDSAHVTDRRLDQRIALNYFWLKPGGRPLVIEPHGNTNLRSGPDTPYTGSDRLQRTAYSGRGSTLMVQPSEYVAPPEPILAPPLSDAGPVWPEW